MKLEFSRHTFAKYSNTKLPRKSVHWEPGCSVRRDALRTEIVRQRRAFEHSTAEFHKHLLHSSRHTHSMNSLVYFISCSDTKFKVLLNTDAAIFWQHSSILVVTVVMMMVQGVCIDCIYLAHDRKQWWAIVGKRVTVWIPLYSCISRLAVGIPVSAGRLRSKPRIF
jgi:hypothetical protein